MELCSIPEVFLGKLVLQGLIMICLFKRYREGNNRSFRGDKMLIDKKYQYKD